MSVQGAPIRILFVCSKNQWRSPTAEAVWRKVPGVDARSAGTATSARRKVTLGDIRWADVILVMEDKHAARLRADFRQDVAHTPIHVLDIPDQYKYMDPELVDLIREVSVPIIEAERAAG